MADCVPLAYGDSPWGTGPYAGVLQIAGGPLPYTDDFSIYCVGACGEMPVFLDYEEVQEYAGDDQITVDFGLSDIVMASGGSSLTDTARIFVDVGVSSTWTLECTFRIDDMPYDFVNLTERHLFIGTADRQGGCAGLFFSQIGLAYTGSTFYDTDNNLVVNSAMQVLPNSIGLVQPGVFNTIRLVVDTTTGTTYIYVTETAQVPVIGHQLKYILPVIPSLSQVVPPEDGTTLSVRGTLSEPTTLVLDTVCLGDGVIIPNTPPVADAGVDQAARTCSIIRLDGRKSYDPEGANITYQWRLVDGPITSAFVLSGDDGFTTGMTQTNKFYSEEASVFADNPGISAGDVLLLGGVPYTLVGTGTDGTGFYLQVDGHVLDGGLSARSYRILKQNTISGPTTAQPTFYPDVPGLFKFDLTVYDGNLFSPTANTIVNVTESAVPRGCLPDVKFLWNYLSDFWRLVDGTEVIETFWGALAQIAASELLTLWQTEYSKSLRDVQRTFQRRWLHYDLFIQEPEIELTTIRAFFAGVQSIDLDLSAGPDIAGQTLFVVTPDGVTHEVFLTHPDVTGPGLVPAIRALLARVLSAVDPRFTVDLVQTTDGTTGRLVLNAPFPFILTAASTATSLFQFPARNDVPRGAGGTTVGTNGYRVDRSLSDLAIETGDYLVVGGTAYRILRVVTDPADDWIGQRVICSDNLPLNLDENWVIVGATRSTYLDFYNALCSAGDVAVYEVVQNATGELAYIACNTFSAAADGGSALLTEQFPIAQYLTDANYSVYFHSIYRRTNMPVDPLVVEIPVLQEVIRNTDDTAVLRQNIDFYRTTFRGVDCIQFVTGDQDVWQNQTPPKRVWAETTYIDNRPVIEQNFGIPAEFTLDDLSELSANVDYLSCVRGLWYAYFNGPTLYNLRVGTQILLGLPFAEEAGTIVEIDSTFSTVQGRILVQDTTEQSIIRSYTYPRVLSLEVNPTTGVPYVVGDTVVQFAPLVEGVEVADYIKDPKWFEGLLTQGSFFEVEKFFKFLVRIDSAAFSLDTLLFANQFVTRIKPTYTYPVLTVQSAIDNDDSTVSVDDDATYTGTLSLYAGPWFASGSGQAQMFDQPNAAGLGWWNQFDTGPDGPFVPPTYPNAIGQSNWAFDQNLLSPNEVPVATLRRAAPSSETPTADSIFYADLPIFTTRVATLVDGMGFWVPNYGYMINSVTATSGGSVNKAVVFLRGIFTAATSLTLTLKVDGTTVATETFTTPITGTGVEAAPQHFQFNTSFSVSVGDIVSAELKHATTGDLNTFIEEVMIVVGVGEDWTADMTLAAGTYESYVGL